jgi:hypothetical protein
MGANSALLLVAREAPMGAWLALLERCGGAEDTP